MSDVDLDAVDDALDDDESDESRPSSRLARARRYAPSLVGALYVGALALFVWNLTTLLSTTYVHRPIVVIVAAFLLSLGGAIDYYRTRVGGEQ